ncbi:endonuclease/exonuclease/phosphatase family protein [Phytoactinopolyspora alkaliphila]|uniref:Endonuclease/exonuclease/phosphatase family protein n=1 Tax=Phytoactinopolyspora alkaliphila TaxID=1783498 RepID=A0A6N9YHQ6_9ACTN|nr:endonuclease/exonuclease/phosphatase family protein [Phytoactinopolyspora alkaliphila]
MTWNVWWRFGDRWRDRQAGIASTIATQQPDILGLQESWASRESAQAEALAASLGMYSAFAGPSLPALPAEPESPDYRDIDLGVAVLSRWHYPQLRCPLRATWSGETTRPPHRLRVLPAASEWRTGPRPAGTRRPRHRRRLTSLRPLRRRRGPGDMGVTARPRPPYSWRLCVRRRSTG